MTSAHDMKLCMRCDRALDNREKRTTMNSIIDLTHFFIGGHDLHYYRKVSGHGT